MRELKDEMIKHGLAPVDGYDSVRKWIKEETKEVAPQLPSGDLAVSFDNDYVIGKSWHSRPINMVSSSTETNAIVVSIDMEVFLITEI